MTKKPFRTQYPRHDWQSIIDSIHVIEAHEQIQVNEQTQQYVRLQRFVRKFGQGQSRDNTLLIAKEFNLNWKETARLYISLGILLGVYRVGESWEDAPTKSAGKRKLKRVRKSIARVATFQKEDGEALAYLVHAADRWAEKQDFETLRGYGFHRTEFRLPRNGVAGVDFGSTAVVRQWFELSPLMLDFANVAIDKLELHARKSNVFAGDASAIVSLVGNRLPQLYEQITGQEFGVSRVQEMTDGVDDVVSRVVAQDVTGVHFVGMALQAMGLERLKPETIASYRRRYHNAA